MASETAALAIYLDAPLQSWGVSSRFQRRGTESAPSKSGVLGLIAAAMGIDKHGPDESERLAPLSACRFSVFPLATGENTAPVLRLEDFHTVGGGYDRDDPVDKLRIARKASGGVSTTIVTRRFYLEQARFAALIEGDSGILQKASAALDDPVWGVWFGRKCCLPAAPLLPTLASSISKALDALLHKTGSRIVGEGRIEQDGDGAWHHPDQPVSFGRREFISRPLSRSSPGN
jgi:CRISPR system Cascade subunit CasD